VERRTWKGRTKNTDLRKRLKIVVSWTVGKESIKDEKIKRIKKQVLKYKTKTNQATQDFS
jgi:hypothetical protein